MLSLDEVLEAHDRHRHLTPYANLLGDGFLYAHNPVYRNLRDRFERMGFALTDRDFCDYHALPSAALVEMLDRGKVIYRDNTARLNRLREAQPGVFLFSEIGGLHCNSVIHESAHLVAHPLLAGSSRLRAPTEEDLIARRVLAEEAFACATSCMANAAIEGPLHEAFFKFSDSFGRLDPEARIRRSIGEGGFVATFENLFLSYLFALHLWDDRREEAYRLALAIGERSPSETRRSIFEIGFALNTKFRTQGSRFYLKRLGLRTGFAELVSAPFYESITREFLREDLAPLARGLEPGSLAAAGATAEVGARPTPEMPAGRALDA